MFNYVILNNFIEKDPGFIVGPISKLLGIIINFVFKIVYTITTEHSLGFTIILFTIIVRLLLLPLNYKQQKSMYIMQKIQPEMKKIQDKYKGNKDPEVAKKMQLEMTKLYSKHNYNPIGGCLPIFIQLPIFIALYFIMKNAYLFVTDIGNLYTQIANQILSTPNYAEVMVPIVAPLVPRGMTIDISLLPDMLKAINKFSPSDWEALQAGLPSLDISNLLAQKASIEYFLGINLAETVGLSFPKVLLAILSGATTFLSSWVMSRNNKSDDPTLKMQQKIMNIVMPLMMTFFTISIPCGVAIYWIVGNLVQIIQQIFLSKYCIKKFEQQGLATK
ncbi:YidC/Oxa1 family membrane protein insertase [[Clostridium] colinum]|uniref:YidC/Oxa1 family membrane protein insertase n=1 Tax=[Clostridium] colinum TaxID=36835 RepID=UPI002025B15D|nr:YidC/Oxa1 family membrane protein insertase [[Clostridium] colinum]